MMNDRHLQVRIFSLSVGIALLLCCAAMPVGAAPGDIVFVEYFNNDRDFNTDWSASGSGAYAVNNLTFSSARRALALNEGNIIVTTKSGRIAGAVPGAEISVWVRRGSDAFGEYPDAGEDLSLQYLADNGLWINLQNWAGGGIAGEIFQETIALPENALHANMRFRFNFAPASGAGYDYWHIDDVVVTETAPASASVCRQIYANNFSSASDFNSDWTAAGSGKHQVNARAFSSAPNSLSLWAGDISVTSRDNRINADVHEARVSVWVRQGADSFSEDVDNGEDLFLEYRNASGVWRPLQVWAGSAPNGQITQRTVTLPDDGLHANLRLRFLFPVGSGTVYDYWHIDDVVVNQTGVCTSSLDHFDVLAASTASTCESHPVNVQAVLADGSVDTNYVGSINLSTSTGHGDWVVAEGRGTLVTGALNSGMATYTFSALDNGGALASGTLLALKNASEETVNINIADGSVTELSNSALPGDPDISFLNSLLSFSVVGDQIAGKPSDIAPMEQTLTVQAISTNPANGLCERRLPAGPHTLEFAAECINPTGCAMENAMHVNDKPVPVNAQSNVSVYKNVSLDFDASASANYILNYVDAGQIALHARVSLVDEHSGPALTLRGNTAPFVVRPFGFYIDVAGNPAAADANGLAFKKAGEDFAVTLRAVAWQAADDGDADGAPDLADSNGNADLADNPTTENFGNEASTEAVTVTNSLFLPAGGVNPGVASSPFLKFTDGSSFQPVSWNEVGIVQLQAALSDSQYLGSGAVTGNVVSALARVGRFIPDHFVITDHTLTHRSDLSCPGAGFTYMGENAELEVQLQAQNVSGDVTQNYIDDFAKLNLWTDDPLTDEVNLAAVDQLTSADLSPRLAVSGVASYAWNNGLGLLATDFSLDRAAVPDGSILATLAINPIDDDGVSLLPASIDMDVDGDSSNDHSRLTAEGNSEEFRFGRIRINNAFGPETRELPIAMNAEYFDTSSGWRIADDDSCTRLLNSELLVDGGGDFDATVGSGTSTAVPGHVVPGSFVFYNGDAGLNFTAPGSGNVGEFDLGASLANYPWLQFDWNGDGNYNNDPAGVITFGQYRGNDHIIYWREVH